MKEMEPKHDHIWTLTPQGFQRMAYVEWGDEQNSQALLCVHGLTRNSRDFDFLAQSLQNSYHIICPDLLGRGESGYLQSPQQYTFSQYISDTITLMARLNAQDIHWLGTSLGGIIGMMLAAQPNSPLKSLILNDVGMIVPSPALKRQEIYARNDNIFQSLHEAKCYFQTVLSPSRIADPNHWDHITQYGIKRDDEGNFRLAYDPAIGHSFANTSSSSLHLETYWQAIKCPILVIRGEESDFLPPEIISKMLYFQPNTKVVTIPQCGHAPSLMTPDQIQVVEEWLNGTLT